MCKCGQCRKCKHRKYNRERMLRVYRERHPKIEKIKTERGCIDCGYNIHPAALHFDHKVPGMKRFKISGSYMRSWKSLMDEINKCDVRCANCHSIKHANETRKVDGMGTYWFAKP